MSSMMETVQSDQSGQNGVTQFMQNVPHHCIKRMGGRPIVFEGSELAMAMSFSPAVPFWYEINLYRTKDQQFVATVRLFFQSAEKEDTVRGWECSSLEEAIEKLMHYDAADDVRLSPNLAEGVATSAELAAGAMELRAQIKAHRNHYASLIGEFLYDLENGS